ncbi:MAG: GNAT family N-acetyltransferase [Bacteroidales bacterium]|nr:GNAT family N-acetyltransferase [Bacteroidales bacterium]
MNITRVTDRRSRKKFHDTARHIYSNDPVWVCPLDKDIESIFDPAVNPYFKHGEVDRWILEDDKGTLIGRVAAFIDNNLAHTHDQPTGGMGFFECINDITAATILFDTARNWLAERGMEAMDGPINFGETDKYWGMLVDGFTHPSFDVPYNHPYYKDLFEAYGFRTYYNMEGFHLDITKPLDERFQKIAEWVVAKPGYSFSHFTWKEEERFTLDFAEVFNEAWASFKTHFEPLKPEYIREVLKKAKAIVDEEFIWIAYFEGKPIAIYLMFPDVNQIFKHLNGKMHIFNMIKFLWLKRKKTMTRAKGLLMGVIPKYQNHGIESAFILHVRKVFEKKPHYTEVEFSWVADFNPKMRKIFISVGSIPVKKYSLFRYLFDRNKEFKRYPIPEIK